ncbi:MAG: hypothetical protein JWO67_5295 [Streptosporangiaceae bacterium]|nr:hypothetical protein [Streptosporangiaceae bacterium]
MQTSTPSPLLGRIAFIAACAGTVLGPLHALARFATHDGAGDLKSPFVHWWAVPAGHTFGWLVRWGSADTVYLTYGKLLAPVAIAATVFAFAVRRSRTPVGLERWGWPIALTGYVLASAAVLGEYWTPWLDQSFMFLALPGILVSLIGSTILGIALLRRGFRPRTTGWLLATWIVSLIVLNSVVAMSAALIPMLWAWGVAGRAASRRAVPSEPVPVA